jgi:hypothetical protein
MMQTGQPLRVARSVGSRLQCHVHRTRVYALIARLAIQGLRWEVPVPQYLIQRNIPGAGKLTPVELQAISQKSCSVLNRMGPQIQWVHSYVTDDQVFCVYRAPNEQMLLDHARQGGFPADKICEIKTTIDPTTAE